MRHLRRNFGEVEESVFYYPNDPDFSEGCGSFEITSLSKPKERGGFVQV